MDSCGRQSGLPPVWGSKQRWSNGSGAKNFLSFSVDLTGSLNKTVAFKFRFAVQRCGLQWGHPYQVFHVNEWCWSFRFTLFRWEYPRPLPSYGNMLTLHQEPETFRKERRTDFGLLPRWLNVLCLLNGAATDTTSGCLKQLLCDIPNQLDWLELKPLLTSDWQFNDMGGEQQLMETGQ